MDKTLLIAMIGCITGASSLIIQLTSYLSTVAHLKINTDESSHSYFFNTKSFNVQGYITNFSAVVSLIISNKSSYPVTIDSIYIIVNKAYKIKHFNNFKFHPLSINIDENTTTCLNPSKSITLPLRIEAFDTIFASATFPFFDKLIDNSDLTKPVEFNLIISTPRKIFRHKVKLYEYMYYHDHLLELRNK